jgi:hypothetical protein
MAVLTGCPRTNGPSHVSPGQRPISAKINHFCHNMLYTHGLAPQFLDRCDTLILALMGQRPGLDGNE